MLKTILYGVLLAAAVTAAAWAADSGPKADVAAVRAAEMSTLSPLASSKVENVHVVGDYAVLDWIEPPSRGESLYKRVSGEAWKRLVSWSGNFTQGDAVAEGVPRSIARLLLPGRPVARTPAATPKPDSGPEADIAAVRTFEISRWKHARYNGRPITVQVSNIHVIGDYAILDWEFSEAGGEALYKRVSGEQWKRVTGGGGAMGASDLIAQGVPAAIARKLIAANSK